MTKKHPEKILCVKESITFNKGKWNGIKTDNLDYYKKVITDNMEFRSRDSLEKDSSYKQIIAQVVLKYKDKYFLHKQTNRGETRLNSLCPLPLGGHIEQFDVSNKKDFVEVALEREMHEEADVKAKIIKREFVGLIYVEDDNPVNWMHIGFVYIFDLDSDKVHVKEEGLEEIGFVTKEYLQNNINTLTYWSRYIISYL